MSYKPEVPSGKLDGQKSVMKNHNESIADSKVMKSDAIKTLDATITSVLVLVDPNGGAVTELGVNTSEGVDTILFGAAVPLEVGDTIQAEVLRAEEAKEKPYFDEATQIWMRPSDETVFVDRLYLQVETATSICKMSGTDVLFEYRMGHANL